MFARKLFAAKMLASDFLFALLIASSTQLVPVALADEDSALKKADSAFVQAASAADKKALSSMLDPEFTWTDSAGKTFTRSEILRELPTTPANSTAAEIQQRSYGDVGLVLAVSGKTHAARFWVRRSKAWRLLIYHEATLAEEARSGAPRPKECENPCKTLFPTEPKERR